MRICAAPAWRLAACSMALQRRRRTPTTAAPASRWWACAAPASLRWASAWPTTWGFAFIELSREIEQFAGCSIHEIHALYGTPAYRRYERRALEETIQLYPEVVIATPGGLVSDAANFNLLLGHCRTVWLQADPADHMARVAAQGDMRPMAASRGGHGRPQAHSGGAFGVLRQGRSQFQHQRPDRSRGAFEGLQTLVREKSDAIAAEMHKNAHSVENMHYYSCSHREDTARPVLSTGALRRLWLSPGRPGTTGDTDDPETVDYRTDPSQYHHWKLSVDGPVATLAVDIDEDAGIRPGYKLKLNSYDLGVDIELHDALNRIRFEHPACAPWWSPA